MNDSTESNNPLEDKAVERNRLADELAAQQSLFSQSICLKCVDHRSIVSGKGSVFMLCQSQETPENWPKYPPQPMRRCKYFRPIHASVNEKVD